MVREAKVLVEKGKIGKVEYVNVEYVQDWTCLLYTSDAADEEDSVDLGGRRIIKKTSF